MNSINFFCGTSGIVLPVPNKHAFPEAYRGGTRLTYYASLFNSLEINSSFYKIPQQKTLARWVEETPPAFRFTIKLWRGITHAPSLAFGPADVQRFMQAASGLGPKKGCLLVQFPPGIKATAKNQLERLLEIIKEKDDTWPIAVEFRDKSWYTPATDQLLEKFKACRVLQDMPSSARWDPMPTASFVFFRYHGIAGDYKGSYPELRLREDAASIEKALSAGKEVYAYFNNTIGDAIANAQFLAGKVEQD